MKIFKYLSIFILIFLMIFTVSVSGKVIPVKELQAIVVIDDVAIILWIAAALAVGGCIYQERQAIKDLANQFWDWCTLDRRAVIAVEAEEAFTTGRVDYTNEDWADIRTFLDEKLDEKTYPQVIIEYFDIVSPWGVSYMTNGIGQPSESGTVITPEQYASLYVYPTIYWQDSNSQLDYRLYLASNALFRNGVRVTTGQLWCPNVYYNNDYTGHNIQYFKYYALTLGCYSGSSAYFTFYYNSVTSNWYPGVVYRDAAGVYKIRSIVYGSDYTHIVQQQEAININVIYDPVIARDEDYDIVIDGHRYVDMVKDISQLVGLTAADILEGKFQEIEAELVNLGVLTAEIESWREYIERLTYLEQLTYLEELTRLNELTFTETGELVVSATIVNQFELDIPVTPFNLPVIEVLASKFPFCIPFDLYYAVLNLQAESVAPEFEINFPASVFGGEGNMMLDFSAFEVVAVVIRWTILLGFLIGLIILTRKLIRG